MESNVQTSKKECKSNYLRVGLIAGGIVLTFVVFIALLVHFIRKNTNKTPENNEVDEKITSKIVELLKDAKNTVNDFGHEKLIKDGANNKELREYIRNHGKEFLRAKDIVSQANY